MAGRNVPILCYWDGKVMKGAEGIDYDGPSPRVIRASNGIKLKELVEMVYGVTGWNKGTFDVEIIGRYLAGTSPTRCFISLPIVDDASIASMFDVTLSPQSGWNCIQLYLMKKRVVSDNNMTVSYINPLDTKEWEEASLFHSSVLVDEHRTPSISSDSHGVINELQDLNCIVEGTDLRGDEKDKADKDIVDGHRVWKPRNDAGVAEKQQSSSIQNEEELYVGQKFDTKDELKRAVKLFSINTHRQYIVKDTSPHLYVLKCKQTPNCPWHLRASVRNENSFFEIIRLRGPHTCTDPIIDKDHVQLDSAFIASEVKDFVKAGLSIKHIQKVIASRYNHKISYRKAWDARNKAMGKFHIDDEGSGSSQPSTFKAGPGRPRKKQQPNDDAGSSQLALVNSRQKKQQPDEDAGPSQPSTIKAGRGRPKKKLQPNDDVESSQPSDDVGSSQPSGATKMNEQPNDDVGLSPSAQDEVRASPKKKMKKPTC